MKQIYVHGLGQTAKSWRKTIEKLDTSKCSENIDLVNLLEGNEATYENMYKAFSVACNESEEAIDLCGLSLGGVLALNYTVEYPEKVNSLVLIATQYKMPKRVLQFQNIIFRFMPKSMFVSMGFGKAEFLKLCKSMMNLDFSTSLSKITCPVLVICGEKDSANEKAAKELADKLVNAKLKVISNVGHEINVEAPEELANVLNVFYRK